MVTAARRLIGRYKGSAATKAKIMACVNRKSKKLGCGSKDDAEQQYPGNEIENHEADDPTEDIPARATGGVYKASQGD